MANFGIAPEEKMLFFDGINDKSAQIQKDAHEWWENTRSKRAMRGKYRGLTITQIYMQVKNLK